MAAASAPVYGLSCDLPEGLRLSTSVAFTPAPKLPRHTNLWDLKRQPQPAHGTGALVKSCADSAAEEEVLVDGKYGPLIEKVGGSSDHVRMGLQLPGRQRKWWFEASTTEREVYLIQAGKVNQGRRNLEPPSSDHSDFSVFNRTVQDRLKRGVDLQEKALWLPEDPAPALPSAVDATKDAAIFEPPAAPLGANAERPFDIVVYGATGFTGTLIVEHLDLLLVEPRPRKLRWALAGRSMDRLMTIAANCKTHPSIVLASDPGELATMAASSRVVIAAAGPYSVCGEAVVEACVENGTHYVDVTGEAYFVHNMVAAYHERARSRGVMVVHCAGQIATPDDINCYLLVKRLGPLKWFREYWNSVDAVTGGTFNTSISSLQDLASPEVLRVELDPFNLGGRRKCDPRPEDEDCRDAEKDEVVFQGTWLEPTYNSRPGSRIVRRSCELFEQMPSDGLAYGESLSVTIREPAASQKAAQKTAQEKELPPAEIAADVATMLRGQQERGEMPPPGQGPPPDLRARHWSEIFAVAESEEGKKAFVHYTGPQSYEVTAMCSVNVALTLVEEPEAVKAGERGGVLTPAFAMHGTTFIERLQSRSFGQSSGRKMQFQVQVGLPSEKDLKKGLMDRMRDFVQLQGELMAGALKPWGLPALLRS